MPNNALTIIVRAIVTLALLAYGWTSRTVDPATGSLIIGAVVGYWLSQGEQQARRLIGQSGGRAAPPDGR